MSQDEATEIRYRRMAHAREVCLQEMRRHLGSHLPLPVVAAVNELALTMMRLDQIPDDQLENTTLTRRRR